MNFADDGVSADADLGGDLAASQSGDDAALELLDPLRGPSFNAHNNGLAIAAAVLGRRQGMAARNRQPRDGKVPKAQIRCAAR